MNALLACCVSGKTSHPAAAVPGYVSPIDFEHDRERLTMHLVDTVWAPSGIPELQHKATVAAMTLRNHSKYPEIVERAQRFLAG